MDENITDDDIARERLRERKERAHLKLINRHVPFDRRRWFRIAEAAKLLGITEERLLSAVYHTDIGGVINLQPSPHASIRLRVTDYVWVKEPARPVFADTAEFLWLPRREIIAWCRRMKIELPVEWVPSDNQPEAPLLGQSAPVQHDSTPVNAKAAPTETLPAKGRKKAMAAQAVNALWPDGVPDSLPNPQMSDMARDWIEEHHGREVARIGDHTVERAAGRRKD